MTEITILLNFARSRKLSCVAHSRVLQGDHEMVVRGISVRKRSVHNSGGPQFEGEPWSRLGTPPTIVSNIEDFVIFLHTRYSLGEVCGGARVWQESCAWGRDYPKNVMIFENSPKIHVSKIVSQKKKKRIFKSPRQRVRN